MNSNETYVSVYVVERRANRVRQQLLADLLAQVWKAFTGQRKAAGGGQRRAVPQVLFKPQ